ncbi:hypothetical protein M8J76_011017 [Diaphorina citri]|nr:hypothetical protein M8J76_011017 [Diaphorina citri]
MKIEKKERVKMDGGRIESENGQDKEEEGRKEGQKRTRDEDTKKGDEEKNRYHSANQSITKSVGTVRLPITHIQAGTPPSVMNLFNVLLALAYQIPRTSNA